MISTKLLNPFWENRFPILGFMTLPYLKTPENLILINNLGTTEPGISLLRMSWTF